MQTLTITAASLEDAPLVYDIMQQAFAQYLGVLTPPSGAHAEVVDDVIRVMGEGGAILAWLGGEAVGSARYAFHDERDAPATSGGSRCSRRIAAEGSPRR